MYEGAVCICCMGTEDLQELFSNQFANGVLKNPAKTITACFGIKLSEQDGHDSICDVCIRKMADIAAFKKQILQTISILMSVKIENLLPNLDDVTTLGLTQEVDDDDENWEVEAVDDEFLYDDEEMMNRDKFGSVYGEDVEGVVDSMCTYIDEDLWSLDEAETKSSIKEKRRRGRPRKYAKSCLPYKIGANDTKCMECDTEFPNNIILKRHYNSHYPNHPCKECGKCFMTAQSLIKHARTHLSGPFVCDVCDMQFKAFYTLASHKRLKHSLLPVHKCPLCDLRFESKYAQLRHSRQDHGLDERKYKCSKCDLRFRMSVERSRHEATHQNIVYSCPRCDFTSTRQLVRAHLANKHDIGEKKHQCDMCDKKFNRRWTLLEHLKSHMDIRRFKCSVCGKSFVQKCVLKRHLLGHLRRGEYSNENEIS